MSSRAAKVVAVAVVTLVAAGLPGCGGGDGSTLVEGCPGQRLRPVPVDLASPGPWPVGAVTTTVAGLRTEMWYLALPGSESGRDPVEYDIRQHIPERDVPKVSDAENPAQRCECYRDLPLDEAAGPYPVVVFIHGTAGFRTQNLENVVHWASRGFVVLSQDHPRLYLADALQLMMGPDLVGDTTALLDALASPSGDLAFLDGHLDLVRIGMAGHSAGGGGIATFGDRPGVEVLIPMASRGVAEGAALRSTVVMGARDDGVVPYSSQVSGYDSSPKKKRLVGLSNAGHLAFSDLCGLLNSDGEDLVEIAIAAGVTNANLFSLLWDGCDDGQLAPSRAIEIVNYVTAAAFEEQLRCDDRRTAQLAALPATFTEVFELREELE
ncbi:MAG: hypothetical protein KC731_07495 [Myxococcales bacterium]|nr:hypothetical protein [Myxococcales bacterium]